MLSRKEVLPLVVAALSILCGSVASAEPGFCFSFTQPRWEETLDASGLERLLIVLRTPADRDQPATRILAAEAGQRGVDVAFVRNPGTLPRSTFAVQELTSNRAQLLASVEISPGSMPQMAALEFRDETGQVKATFTGFLVEGENCAIGQSKSAHALPRPRKKPPKMEPPPAAPEPPPIEQPLPEGITLEQLETFAGLVDDKVDVVRARLLLQPDLVPLATRALDASRARRPPGMALAITGGVMLQLGILYGGLIAFGEALCAGADSGSGDMCKDTHSEYVASITMMAVGVVATFAGLLVLSHKSEAEAIAKTRYNLSVPPPTRSAAVSSPRGLPSNAPKAFLFPLMSTTF